MKNFLKRNKFFLSGFLILVWVIFVNIFPDGYVFGGGDTTQILEAQDSFSKMFFDLNGAAGFFYYFFYLLGKIGISNTSQLSFYLGFIIIGSYLSFGVFSKLFFRSSDLIAALVSLFYALNLYTLFLFTGNWGYSYFPSLYVFIPILMGLFLRFLKTNEIFYGLVFCIALVVSSPGFGNPAFALSFGILLALTTLFSVIIKITELNKRFILNFTVVAIMSFLASSFWILPIISQIKDGVQGLVSSEVLEFEYVIRSGSSSIYNIFALIHPSEVYFPVNFYYKNFDFLKEIFIVISFVPMLIIFLGTFFSRKFENKKIFFLVSLLMITFVMLVSKVRPPFEVINSYIYHIYGFQTLRGFDKTAIYIPFFIATLILIISIEKSNKKWVYTLLALSLFVPLPFYIGKLQQTAGYRVSTANDYTKAKMSFLVKVPKEYYKIRNLINSDKEKSFIATLPSTYNDGSGISYYPKWKLYGVDITYYLYNKGFISANGFNFPNWNFSDDFNNDFGGDYAWIIKTLGMMNSKYIIFHKDAPEDSVNQSEFKMRTLERDGLIKNLEENDYFILYEISSDYFVPYISWQRENVDVSPEPRMINRNFEKIKESTRQAEFHEINPKKYIVNFEDGGSLGSIVLAETFNPLWKAYYVTDSGREIEIDDHFVARGYANGWNVKKNQDTREILIEYYPSRLMKKGIWISSITILFLLIYILKYYYDRKNKT